MALGEVGLNLAITITDDQGVEILFSVSMGHEVTFHQNHSRSAAAP
jgi:hypothetical protein